MTVTRGTSNRNVRGSAEQRRRRKHWVLDVYRANVDLLIVEDGPAGRWVLPVPIGSKPEEQCLPVEVQFARIEKATRCYRCGELLWFETLTVDKIIPQCKGGTYRRNNIRPACGGCNSETGGALANGKEHQAAKKAAQRRARKKAVLVKPAPSHSRVLPSPPPLPSPGMGPLASTYSPTYSPN